MESKKPTLWTDKIELNLVELVYGYKSLWKVKEEEDFGTEETEDITRIRDYLNTQHSSGFSNQQIIKKWLEIRMLFDLKYAINGYSLEDRGNHVIRDGSTKDILTESWKLFKKLGYLVDPNSTSPVTKPEKRKKGRPAQY